jgi:hypothetical protein
VQQIDNRLHFFNGEENHESHCARFGREAEDNHAKLDAMKVVYAQITTIRHSQNLAFKNVLLFIVYVSVKTHQMHIAKTIRAFRYSIQKAINRQIHVNWTCENFWGWVPQETLM